MLTKKQAAEKLGISLSTFKRRVALGQYKAGTSTGEQSKVGEITRFFSHEDLGLTEDGETSAEPRLPEHDPPIEGVMPELPPGDNVSPRSILLPYQDQPIEIDEVAPVLHPQEYRDSLGNKLGDRNPRSLIDAMFGTQFFETSVPKVERIRDPYGDRARALAKRRNGALLTGYGITPEQLEAAISKGKRS